MEVGDKLTWEGYDEAVFSAVVINKNRFREPSLLHLLDIYQNAKHAGEVFVGEDFFEQYEIEEIKL